ncbi:hypothetical protein [Spirulina sp. 06S082]|uniref:hypothetical protein n=1 Tax=Spirulina sp. 06S082 TaxID=3110248 RepID=UPI002B2157CD|nr:hypothetical protein [Spirulina sp. 06S082]MEA5472065.1 hypothetical protein [Spirulina sp. 06S082]
MVQQNIYLKSLPNPYFTFEENPISLGKSQDKQLKEIAEIGRQCFAIACLNKEDWQQIGTAISPVSIRPIQKRVHQQFLPSHRVLKQFAATTNQCWKLISLGNEDWQNMTNFFSRQ